MGLVLQELSMKTFHHEFVKKAVTMSFDQTNESSGREARGLLYKICFRVEQVRVGPIEIITI